MHPPPPGTTRPAPFSVYTTPEFWDDPHISAGMLAAHLDPDRTAASRTHAFIDGSVDWLVEALNLSPGSRLLDLGCGPGLYAVRLAERGVQVLGIDVSHRSLAHAREQAEARGLPASFRDGSYLSTDLGTGHDAAILIYEDYCVLSPDQRAQLLRRVGESLAPGGRLALDVTSAARFEEIQDSAVRSHHPDGSFWAAGPHDVLQETWTYPELRLVLYRYTVTTPEGSREFWNWMHCLTPEQVSAELTAAGFDDPTLHGDVAGAPFDPASPTFAVTARHGG